MRGSVLGDRVRMLRERAGLSRKDVGQSVGYVGDSAYQTVYEWETGRRGIPADLVPDIARTIGVSITDIYGGNGMSGSEASRESIADRVTARLLAAWDELPESERAFLREVAEATERFRERLMVEEGLKPGPRSTPNTVGGTHVQ